jgi:beta-alanine--pyruvate transaminase
MMQSHGSSPDHAIELFHGYTYSGHPVACAAAIATLQLFDEEGLFERAGRMGTLLGQAVHGRIKGLPHVVGIRTLGLAAAVELAPGPVAGQRAYEVFMRCFHRGLLIRPAGENLVLCPPYIVEPAQMDQMVEVLARAIAEQA